MSSDDPIYELVNNLPSTSLTGALLKSLDFIVPGQWKNITNFDELIKDETGESDEDLIQQVGERAIQLYTDAENGYQRAVWCFQKADSVDKGVVAASALNLIGQKFDLQFIQNITPQPETAQAIDAAVKFGVELATFRLVNGLPGDGIAELTRAITSYAKDDAIRLAAFVAFDCVLPLGPNFLDKISGALSSAKLSENSLFRSVQQYLPGSSEDEQKTIIESSLRAVGGQLTGLAESKGVTQSGILAKIKDYVVLKDDRWDLIAATIDFMTNYYQHTGTQSVARRLIARSYSEI